MIKEKNQILNGVKVNQKIKRICFEILENHIDASELILVGIKERGFVIAQKLLQELEKESNISFHLLGITVKKSNMLDVNLENPQNIDLDNKTVILIDDVLNSGKTLMYSARELLKYNLKKLNTVILVNRKHSMFPIRADFVGLSLATTMKEHISVEFDDEECAVYLT